MLWTERERSKRDGTKYVALVNGVILVAGGREIAFWIASWVKFCVHNCLALRISIGLSWDFRWTTCASALEPVVTNCRMRSWLVRCGERWRRTCLPRLRVWRLVVVVVVYGAVDGVVENVEAREIGKIAEDWRW